MLGQRLKGLERRYCELLWRKEGVLLVQTQRIHQCLVVRCDHLAHSI
jgi:hypothetical protein